MSEEIETTQDDQVVTPDNFSFYDMMSNVSYPKDSITVSLAEDAAYEAAKVQYDFETTDFSKMSEAKKKKAAKEFEQRIEQIAAEVKAKSITFDLTGVSDELIEETKTVVDDLFMDKRKQRKLADGSIQKYLPEDQQQPYLRMLNASMNALMIERVTYQGNGVVFVAPDPDMIAHFYDTAPTGAKVKLNEALAKLRVNAVDYESLLDEGFFQKS